MTLLYCLDAFLVGGLIFGHVAFQAGQRAERRNFRFPKTPRL